MLFAIKLALLALYVLLPGLVIGWGNSWQSRRVTLLRSAGALLAAWLWLAMATAISADFDVRLAQSEAEMERATYGDGSRLIGVVLAGWAPSAILVGLWWFLSPGRWRARRRNGA